MFCIVSGGSPESIPNVTQAMDEPVKMINPYPEIFAEIFDATMMAAQMPVMVANH